jgi:hypothetical protein
MCRRFLAPALIATLAALCAMQSASAFNLGYSRGVNWGLERIQFYAPVLQHCMLEHSCEQTPDDELDRLLNLKPTDIEGSQPEDRVCLIDDVAVGFMVSPRLALGQAAS